MAAAIPDELKCPLCHWLLEDAVMLPCCAVNVCDPCGRDSVGNGDGATGRCPLGNPDECDEDGISADDFIPNRRLRSKAAALAEQVGPRPEKPKNKVAAPAEEADDPSLTPPALKSLDDDAPDVPPPSVPSETAAGDSKPGSGSGEESASDGIKLVPVSTLLSQSMKDGAKPDKVKEGSPVSEDEKPDAPNDSDKKEEGDSENNAERKEKNENFSRRTRN